MYVVNERLSVYDQIVSIFYQSQYVRTFLKLVFPKNPQQTPLNCIAFFGLFMEIDPPRSEEKTLNTRLPKSSIFQQGFGFQLLFCPVKLYFERLITEFTYLDHFLNNNSVYTNYHLVCYIRRTCPFNNSERFDSEYYLLVILFC